MHCHSVCCGCMYIGRLPLISQCTLTCCCCCCSCLAHSHLVCTLTVFLGVVLTVVCLAHSHRQCTLTCIVVAIWLSNILSLLLFVILMFGSHLKCTLTVVVWLSRRCSSSRRSRSRRSSRLGIDVILTLSA